ncbi:MAG TPA: hypothetical protein VF478_09540 [Anaerolineae bacterium]
MVGRQIASSSRASRWLLATFVFVALGLTSPHGALAQGPTPTPPPGSAGSVDTLATIVQLALDTLQGQSTLNSDRLFEQSKQSVSNLMKNSDTDIFFLDFGNPNLGLNQFAVIAAKNLLLLTPLYVIGYLIFLIYGVWRERPIPNPLLYTALVIGVMVLLASSAVIAQGIGEIGRVIALALGGTGDALYPRAVLETVLRTLISLQKNGGLLATPVLLVAAAETIVILIQLAYRGISLAIWRLLAVLVIPFSILLEGVNPKTAGKVLSQFFEAWLDIVGKIALLLIVLAMASGDGLSQFIWFILPAGLLVVILSWKFLGVFYTLIRGAIGRAWSNLAPDTIAEPSASVPAAAEAARAQEIDAARRRNLEE